LFLCAHFLSANPRFLFSFFLPHFASSSSSSSSRILLLFPLFFFFLLLFVFVFFFLLFVFVFFFPATTAKPTRAREQIYCPTLRRLRPTPPTAAALERYAALQPALTSRHVLSWDLTGHFPNPHLVTKA
jgi:hypothetical protein